MNLVIKKKKEKRRRRRRKKKEKKIIVKSKYDASEKLRGKFTGKIGRNGSNLHPIGFLGTFQNQSGVSNYNTKGGLQS